MDHFIPLELGGSNDIANLWPEARFFMARRPPASKPSWTDVKAELASFDRLGLLGLIQDLYAAHKDNQTFLHSRFGLGADVLMPYKETLDRWLCPDVLRNQDTSVVKAKQAISSYRKAVGDLAGLAELMVFYAVGLRTFVDPLAICIGENESPDHLRKPEQCPAWLPTRRALRFGYTSKENGAS